MGALTLADGRQMIPDATLDAGDKSCATGLLPLLKQAMRGIGVGEVVAVRSTARGLERDLPAWCRVAGHVYLGADGDGSYLLRRGGLPLALANAPAVLQEFWLFPVSPNWCNLACTHCLYAASPRSPDRWRISRAELLNVIAQLEEVGARPHFMVTGGEPTLHPELSDLLALLDERGYSFQLMTNGTIVNERLAARLGDFKHLRKVQVSVEGDEPELNDRVYGAGVFERTMAGVRRLRERGVPVALAVTPMAENEARLTAIEQLARNAGAEVKYILLYPLGAAVEHEIRPAKKDPPLVKGDGRLMCDKGVAYSEGAYYPCTVLVKQPWAKLGDTLAEALSTEARARVSAIRERTPACEVCKRGST